MALSCGTQSSLTEITSALVTGATMAIQKPVERSEAPTVRTFLKRHSITVYFRLAFAISWGCVTAVLGPGGVLDTTVDENQVERLLPLAILALAVGPTVAGVLLTGLVDGKAGLRELLSRSVRWRVGGRWYAVAPLTAPLSVAAPLLALQLISPEFRPGIFTTSDKARSDLRHCDGAGGRHS